MLRDIADRFISPQVTWRLFALANLSTLGLSIALSPVPSIVQFIAAIGSFLAARALWDTVINPRPASPVFSPLAKRKDFGVTSIWKQAGEAADQMVRKGRVALEGIPGPQPSVLIDLQSAMESLKNVDEDAVSPALREEFLSIERRLTKLADQLARQEQSKHTSK